MDPAETRIESALMATLPQVSQIHHKCKQGRLKYTKSISSAGAEFLFRKLNNGLFKNLE